MQPGPSDSNIDNNTSRCYDGGATAPPFFMKRILLSPVTHFNALLVGALIVIGVMHNHAHYTMEVDADSYVRNFCRKNTELCQSFVDDY